MPPLLRPGTVKRFAQRSVRRQRWAVVPGSYSNLVDSSWPRDPLLDLTLLVVKLLETLSARGRSASPPVNDCVPRRVSGVQIVVRKSLDPDIERSIERPEVSIIIFTWYPPSLEFESRFGTQSNIVALGLQALPGLEAAAWGAESGKRQALAGMETR